MRALRSTVAYLLALVVCLLVPAALVASWAASQVDDTPAYVDTVGELTDDPVVVGEVTTRLTSAVTRVVQDSPAGVVLDDAGRAQIDEVVGTVLTSDEFDSAWRSANQVAHEQFVALMRGEPGAAEVEGGYITVSLEPLLDAALAELSSRGLTLAEPSGNPMTFRVLPASDLDDVRDAYDPVVSAGLWVPIAAVVVLLAAVLVAPGRTRLRVGVVAGLGTALTCGVLLAGLSVASDVVGLRVSSADRDLVGAVVDVLLGGLRTRAWIAVGGGLVVALLCLVAASVLRRRDRSRPVRPGADDERATYDGADERSSGDPYAVQPLAPYRQEPGAPGRSS